MWFQYLDTFGIDGEQKKDDCGRERKRKELLKASIYIPFQALLCLWWKRKAFDHNKSS
jgi:hypothetical protein